MRLNLPSTSRFYRVPSHGFDTIVSSGDWRPVLYLDSDGYAIVSFAILDALGAVVYSRSSMEIGELESNFPWRSGTLCLPALLHPAPRLATYRATTLPRSPPTALTAHTVVVDISSSSSSFPSNFSSTNSFSSSSFPSSDSFTAHHAFPVPTALAATAAAITASIFATTGIAPQLLPRVRIDCWHHVLHCCRLRLDLHALGM